MFGAAPWLKQGRAGAGPAEEWGGRHVAARAPSRGQCGRAGDRCRGGFRRAWRRSSGLARSGAQVMLIDRNVYSTFQPLLYQVATGGLNPGDVAYPARAVTRAHGARFRLGELAGIDAAARRITLADGERVRLRLPDPGHRRLGCVLRRDRGRRAQPGPVHPPGRGGAARSHHGPPGASRRRGCGKGRELHRGGRRRDGGRAGWRPRRAAQHRHRRRVPRGGPGIRAHQAGRAGPGAAGAIPPRAARLRPASAARPRRRGPA